LNYRKALKKVNSPKKIKNLRKRRINAVRQMTTEIEDMQYIVNAKLFYDKMPLRIDQASYRVANKNYEINEKRPQVATS
jgi:hypothetical protein